jgi:hypothetical protein
MERKERQWVRGRIDSKRQRYSERNVREKARERERERERESLRKLEWV